MSIRPDTFPQTFKGMFQHLSTVELIISAGVVLCIAGLVLFLAYQRYADDGEETNPICKCLMLTFPIMQIWAFIFAIMAPIYRVSFMIFLTAQLILTLLNMLLSNDLYHMDVDAVRVSIILSVPAPLFVAISLFDAFANSPPQR